MKTLKLLIITLLLATSSFAQIKEAAAVDSIFAKWNDAPGCALGIIKDGKLIYAKGYGMANMEYNIPNTENSVFRIGSTSKQFTAACIIRLVQQGKLSLDNTLDEFYPDFPAYAKKISVRHLLNHTSGIRDYLVLSYLKGLSNNDYYTNDDVMQWLTHQTNLNFQPGDEHLYSNSGYWLLGQIVNKAAGIPMADYAEKEIFKPLDMTHTQFYTDHTQIVKNRASGYRPDKNGGYKIDMTTLDLIGDGGIFTTINDLKKWDDAFYKSDVLNRQFWDMMTQQGVLNNGDTIKYACGLFIGTHNGLKTVSHGGAFVGYRTQLLRFPDQHFSVAILTNRADANPSGMATQIADIFLKDKFINEHEEKTEKNQNGVPDVPTQIFTLKQLTGTYTIQPGIDMDIRIKKDTLNITQKWNNVSYNVVATTGNTYQIPADESVSFVFADLKDGNTQIVTIYQNGGEAVCKRKKEIDLSNINMKEYLGKYFSPELDMTYLLTIKGNALQLTIRNKTYDLDILGKDHFTSQGKMFHFKRTNNIISGFEMDAGRVKNLKFVKK